MLRTKTSDIAARQIIEHLLPVAELSGKPMVPVAAQPAQTDGKHSSISIEELELSVRAYNCLKRANINSLGELLKLSYDDLMNIKNFGHIPARNVSWGELREDNPKGIHVKNGIIQPPIGIICCKIIKTVEFCPETIGSKWIT